MSSPDPEWASIQQRLVQLEHSGSPDPAQLHQLAEQLYQRYLFLERGGVTAGGLPYPDPTDPIAEGADAIRALAEAITAALSITRFFGAQTANAVANQNIPYNVVEDTAGAWNPTTNAYTIPTTGLYDIDQAFRQQVATIAAIGLIVNGTRVLLTPNAPNQVYAGVGIHIGWRFTAGDVVSVQSTAAFGAQAEAPYSNFLQITRRA